LVAFFPSLFVFGFCVFVSWSLWLAAGEEGRARGKARVEGKGKSKGKALPLAAGLL
jgi:hypothetical protein